MHCFMRPLIYLVLLLPGLLTCYSHLFAQVPNKQISEEDKAKFENAMPKIQRPSLNFIPGSVASSTPIPNSITTNKFIPQNQAAQRSNAANCADSSFVKIFEAADRSYSFLCSAKTRDGGILIGGYGRNKLTGPPYYWSAVVTKFDSIGNHIWSKEIRSNADPTLYVESMSEMSDGSIIINGWHDNPLSNAPPTPNVDFFVAKLTSSGDLMWLKTFHSLLGNNCTISNIRYTSITEGANGDFFVGGTVANCAYPKYLVVIKFNSLGVIQWKYSLAGPDYDEYCIGIFYEGNQVTVVNRSSEAGGSIHVDMLRLNEANGAYISHKSWKPDLPYPASFYAGFLNWTPQAIRLNNGNYCVYGQTFGEFSITNADMPHFAVLEFDNNYNYVRGYTINSTLMTNLYDDKMEADRFGRVVYCMTTFADPLNKTKYIGAADNGAIVHQRKKAFPNLEVFSDNVELFDDGSYVYINNIAIPGQANFYLYYSLLHNTDTSSLCLGTADNFSHTVPIQYIPHDFSWVFTEPDFLVETNNTNNSILPLIYTASPPCFQKSFCDTIKIHGNPSSCDLQQPFTFTAFKNKECGSRVNWIIDTSVIQSFQTIDDTTIQIVFDQPWQGWLYAQITTSCGIAKDSLLLTVSASPGAVNLGPDTSICTGNSILLNAHKGYASYQWNNGSVDSFLTVTSPGKYYVAVTDACGNFFSDTVIVSPAPPIAFDIGPDRMKCNEDTLQLAAPSGFLNYTWGPVYNINTQTGRQVVVQPGIDTFYFVKAEKTAGCFAWDTINIKVNYSPDIDLGGDISFCTGEVATLIAPAGFDQYQWSNGTLSQQAYVNTPGSYSVIGTTAEGCQSYDAVNVLNVWANPVVTLDPDPALCIGSTRTLQAGNYSSYLWQDGSVSASFVVAGTGTYYVTVLDNHQCAGSDTVHITTLLPAPADFLPADTAICNYGTFLLKPVGNYNNYTWSNNSSSSSINITVPGIYWLQVKDVNNCTGRDSILIGLKECLKGFNIPTAFTPDNNGLNDYFKPVIGGTVKQYQFTIYNRWGQLVFTTKDLYKGWDGTFGGIAQDMNVLAWTCTYQLEGEAVKQEKGTVVVIR